jgi:hypothetical protein
MPYLCIVELHVSQQPPVQRVPGLSRGLRRPGRDADHTPPSSAEVKKELSYTSTHLVGPPGLLTGFPFTCQSAIYKY